MEGLDQYIRDYLRSDQFKSIANYGTNFPVTLTYAIERLIITHVKLYNLEDAVRNPNLEDKDIGQLKRKIDQLNGVDRPRLISSLGDMLAKAVDEHDLSVIREPSTKKYGESND